MKPKNDVNRRVFLESAAASLAFTMVPRNVLGGPGYVAPSDKIALAYIGCGTRYDAQNMKFINKPEANPYLTREYRKGWEL